jgi:hypothetical protein
MVTRRWILLRWIYLFTFLGGGSETESICYVGLLYQPRTIDDDCGEGRWNGKWEGRPKYLEKTCLSGNLSIKSPTWTRTRAAAVGSQRLTGWSMVLPRWIVSREVNRSGSESWTKTGFLYIGGLFYRRLTVFLNSAVCRLDGVLNRFWKLKYLFFLQKTFVL